MLEMILVYALGRSVAAIARSNGRHPFLYYVMAGGLWLGGEIFGALLGSVLSSGDRLSMYGGSCVGALCGAVLAIGIALAIPAAPQKPHALFPLPAPRRIAGRARGTARMAGVAAPAGVATAEDPSAEEIEDDPRENDGPVEGPPDEEFWETYNRRMEFPLSAVGTVFLHVLVAVLLVFVVFGLMNDPEDRSAPDLKLMQVGGLDDAGAGSSGSGGQADPDIVKDVDPTGGIKDVLPTEQAIKEAQADIRKVALDDPNGKLPIAPSNAAAYERLDKSLRDKLLGGRQGEGNQGGKGSDGSAGTGPGGTGSDSTRARGLRWVLRFSVRGGSDYIAQLRSMGAEILIPVTSDRDCIIIPNLDDPKSARTATDADFKRLAGKIQFSDNRRPMVAEIIDSLGVRVPGQPKAFWAFFPKEVEEKLAYLEKGYRGRLPENIEETVYRVTIRGGSYEVVVDEQIAKK
jgi:hypothetical protein